MIKLVIFDLDGVLSSTSIEHFQAWKNVIKKEFDVSIRNEVEELTKGVSRMDSLERILESINKANVSIEDKERLAKEKNNMYVKLIENFDEDNLFDGVIELFYYLQKKGIKIALGSASRNGPNIVKNLGIYDLFDYIVDPSQNRGKPNPDIFLDARDYFGFESNECIGIEDAQAGIDAINSAGMMSVGIILESNLLNCDYVFDTIKDIDYKIFR